MLRRYPGVGRWEHADDVFQEAALRLLRALESVRPADTREFFGLAAEQIRRQLLDLARHYRRLNAAVPEGHSGCQSSVAHPPAPADADLDRWTAFHEAVAELPAESREVLMLTFYHGWTQAQAAEHLGVDVRTVRRWWRAGCDALAGRFGDDLPVT